jgi:hypothetical protein
MPMMGDFAIGVLALALAGAAASWVVGAMAYLRGSATFDPRDRGAWRWLAAAGWPFRLGRLRQGAADPAALANKAMVAFIVCMTVAAATVTLSTNLANLNRVVAR